MTSQDTELIRKVKELEQRLGIMERTNQVERIAAGGQNIIDSSGLVSTVNFPTDQIIDSTGYSTSSTSLVDVPGSTMDSFVLSRAARVQVNMQVQAKNDNFCVGNNFAEIHCVDSIGGDLISVDMGCKWILTGITQNGSMLITGWNMSTSYEFLSISAIFEMSAGTHTLKLRHRVDGSGSSDIGTYILSYLILGK